MKDEVPSWLLEVKKLLAENCRDYLIITARYKEGKIVNDWMSSHIYAAQGLIKEWLFWADNPEPEGEEWKE